MRVEQEDLANPAVTVRPDDDCFHCGEPIGEPIGEPPYVIWQGNDESTTQVGLHVGCAEKLADHLKADAQPRH